MKKLVRALICISISLFVLNCENDEKLPIQGKVQFALVITSSSEDGGRISSQSFPDGAYISLSIETASGSSVYALKKVDLIKLGDGYITAPLALTEGSYRLTDFFVMSAGGEVLYATPKEGSPLAALVEDPLPIHFSIAANGIANLNIQVVDVDQQTPQDFGYASFGVEVIAGGDFSVSLFVGEGNVLSLASGKLELYQGNDLVYEQNLDAKVNFINFKGDPNATYTLFVIKEGYTIKKREYVLSNLLHELDGKPLAFILEPAFTMRVKYHAILDNSPSISFHFFARGIPDSKYNLTIDWGDGTIEIIQETFRSDGFSRSEFMHHFYGASLGGKLGVINITGDISSATLVDMPNPLPLSITSVDLSRLENLSIFSWDPGSKEDTPENIDVSGNPNLIYLVIPSSRIKYLDISNNPLLIGLDILDTSISNVNVNDIIMDLPEQGGSSLVHRFFAFGKSEDNDQQNLAILTEESRLKLIRLRDNYDWEIYPNPQ